jgi:hypothetical protein
VLEIVADGGMILGGIWLLELQRTLVVEWLPEL